MKQIKLIAIAALVTILNVGNAVAEEHKFNSPDISSKLETLVENKMDGLVRKIYEYREYVHVSEQVNNDSSPVPCSNENVAGHVAKETSS